MVDYMEEVVVKLKVIQVKRKVLMEVMVVEV